MAYSGCLSDSVSNATVPGFYASIALSDRPLRQKYNPKNLNPSLLYSARQSEERAGSFRATLEQHGLYSSFQYVLRLSPVVHKKLAELGAGIKSSREAGFDGAQAFSTLLHETVH